MTMSTRFRPWMCLLCGYTMDAASSFGNDDAVPGEGDGSVCLNCGALYELKSGTWQPLSEAAMATWSVARREMLERAQAFVRQQRWDLTKRGGRA